jgi:glycosyltransferase involved in cell wall biosynthesis
MPFDNLKEKIFLAVHAKNHAFRLAEGLDYYGVLNKLCTPYPKFKIASYKINPQRIKSYFFLGALKYLNSRLFKNKFPDSAISVFFDHLVSWSLKKSDQSWIFQCYSGYSENSLRKAKKCGAVTIVERACPHIDFQREILKEEEYLLTGKTPNCSRNIKTDLRMKREYEIADYILVPSLYTAKSFWERGFDKSKILIVPLSGEKITKLPSQPRDNKIFKALCIGGNFYRKGIFYLMKAWQELNLKNAELIVKATIPDEFLYLFQAKNVRLITKHISDQEIFNLYQEANLFVLPSVDEGFGMAAAEAMAAGLPIIVTQNVGMADGITNGKEGFIVPIRNSGALKEKIKFFYDNPGELLKMGEASSTCSKKYSPEEYWKRIIETYNNIL